MNKIRCILSTYSDPQVWKSMDLKWCKHSKAWWSCRWHAHEFTFQSRYCSGTFQCGPEEMPCPNVNVHMKPESMHDSSSYWIWGMWLNKKYNITLIMLLSDLNCIFHHFCMLENPCHDLKCAACGLQVKQSYVVVTFKWNVSWWRLTIMVELSFYTKYIFI